MAIDPEDLLECERCDETADVSDSDSIVGWGVQGVRGKPCAQTCPECTLAVQLFIELGKRRLRLVPLPAVQHG